MARPRVPSKDPPGGGGICEKRLDCARTGVLGGVGGVLHGVEPIAGGAGTIVANRNHYEY